MRHAEGRRYKQKIPRNNRQIARLRPVAQTLQFGLAHYNQSIVCQFNGSIHCAEPHDWPHMSIKMYSRTGLLPITVYVIRIIRDSLYRKLSTASFSFFDHIFNGYFRTPFRLVTFFDRMFHSKKRLQNWLKLLVVIFWAKYSSGESTVGLGTDCLLWRKKKWSKQWEHR